MTKPNTPPSPITVKIVLTGTGNNYTLKLEDSNDVEIPSFTVQQSQEVTFIVDWSGYDFGNGINYETLSCALVFFENNPFGPTHVIQHHSGKRTDHTFSFQETVMSNAVIGTDGFDIFLSPFMFVKDPAIIVKD